MVFHRHLFSSMVFSLVMSKELGWMTWDVFDDVDLQFSSVNADNCRSKTREELMMPEYTVSQIPKYNRLKTTLIFANRTNLVHLHNMALNRAFFYSYILQKMNSSKEAHQIQPNIHYIYLSQAADVNGNPSVINGSAAYFDNNCYYPNWMTMLDFNKTLPLFAPRTWRWDDTFDMENLLREPSLNTAFSMDGGSGYNKNYTNSAFKMNPWYPFWLPDDTPIYDSTHKYTWSVNLKYADKTGKFINNEFESFSFFGPNNPATNDEGNKLPVRFTRPYFDCDRSNKWVVSAVSPIADFMPRYSNWTHLRRPRFVGVVTMDTYFEKIDFNPCDVGAGNPGPSLLSGIHRCKRHSSCKFSGGFGFKRGGYKCKCKGLHRYPRLIEQPYLGSNIEKSTRTEYESGFNCPKVDHMRVLPVVDSLESSSVEFFDERKTGTIVQKRSTNYMSNIKSQRDMFPPYSRNKRSLYGRPQFDQSAYERVLSILKKKSSITKNNCWTFSPSTLTLPGDVGYGVDSQFKYQAGAALRLSHFLSSFLQNIEDSDTFGYIKGGGRLHHDHLFGEVLAIVMSDFKVLSSGIFYEPFIFHGHNESVREFFGPLAYKKDGSFYAVDMAGFSERYSEKEWYTLVKRRWKTNIENLQTYKVRPMIRSDINGSSSVRYEHFPMTYEAPNVDQGNWMPPQFRCDGMVDNWIMTYAVPFFRRIKIANRIEFAYMMASSFYWWRREHGYNVPGKRPPSFCNGVVTVDVPLDLLELNPCPQPSYVANAFKNTARCHTESTTCFRMKSEPFSRTSYTCYCKQGYEYPFQDKQHYYKGFQLEWEYVKKTRGLFSKFDWMRCRIAAASQLEVYWLYTCMCLVVAIWII